LKQAQWTSLVVFLLLIPLTFFVLRLRFAHPVPANESALLYRIARKPEPLSREVPLAR
jgi:phosphatidylglycerol:prolipoprotein diacylglycerol transferase